MAQPHRFGLDSNRANGPSLNSEKPLCLEHASPSSSPSSSRAYTTSASDGRLNGSGLGYLEDDKASNPLPDLTSCLRAAMAERYAHSHSRPPRFGSATLSADGPVSSPLGTIGISGSHSSSQGSFAIPLPPLPTVHAMRATNEWGPRAPPSPEPEIYLRQQYRQQGAQYQDETPAAGLDSFFPGGAVYASPVSSPSSPGYERPYSYSYQYDVSSPGNTRMPVASPALASASTAASSFSSSTSGKQVSVDGHVFRQGTWRRNMWFVEVAPSGANSETP